MEKRVYLVYLKERELHTSKRNFSLLGIYYSENCAKREFERWVDYYREMGISKLGDTMFLVTAVLKLLDKYDLDKELGVTNSEVLKNFIWYNSGKLEYITSEFLTKGK